MKHPATSPLAPSSTGKDTSLLSKALRDLSGASNLKDKRVGLYLAKWALSCPLARRQVNNAVQYVNSATSTHTTGEACKAAVEAYAASLLPPSAMCELVVNISRSVCRHVWPTPAGCAWSGAMVEAGRASWGSPSWAG